MNYLKENKPEAIEEFDSKAFTERSLLRILTPHFVKDGEMFDLGGKTLEVIFTPGHSYGHIMLLDREKKRLFSGDMICDYVIIYFFESDRNAPFFMALDSWKKIKDWKMISRIFIAPMECSQLQLITSTHTSNAFRENFSRII